MTPNQLLENLDSRELTELIAFLKLEKRLEEESDPDKLHNKLNKAFEKLPRAI